MRGILFDLDGTLLDIDLPGFLDRYFRALTLASEPLLADSLSGDALMAAIQSATGRMMESHAGRTNREVFADEFSSAAGLDFDEAWPVYARFYAEVFPGLRGGSGPASGAREVLETAMSLGLRVAIATNPIFPRETIDHRLAWAGLDDLQLQTVTSYETMTACKPHPEYFVQTAALLGLEPSDCMMVGDDRFLDMPAADTGMKTFYVGPSPDAVADYRGSLMDLAGLLPRIVTTRVDAE
ncbi:MAG: HAD family hydrolase [Coriobacteriia bacterium]